MSDKDDYIPQVAPPLTGRPRYSRLDVEDVSELPPNYFPHITKVLAFLDSHNYIGLFGYKITHWPSNGQAIVKNISLMEDRTGLPYAVILEGKKKNHGYIRTPARGYKLVEPNYYSLRMLILAMNQPVDTYLAWMGREMIMPQGIQTEPDDFDSPYEGEINKEEENK